MTPEPEVGPVASPVYFVHRDVPDRWADLPGVGAPPDPTGLIRRFRNGRDGWTIMTWLELRARGHPVELVGDFVPGAICVAHYDDIVPGPRVSKSYLVSIKADRDPTWISEWEVVQSPSSARRARDVFIPYWPQANIVPRDRARGNRVEHVVFMGQSRNLAARFRSEDFFAALSARGVRFSIRERDRWHDYSDADLVLAIRDGTDHFLSSKPANKLVNAWIAGVPAIVGREPAFEHLRRGPLDFHRADTTEDVLSIIDELRSSPALYASILENAERRKPEFSRDGIATAWARFLFGIVRPAHDHWRQTTGPLGRGLRYLLRMTARRLHGRRYVRGYDDEGQRVTFARRARRKVRRWLPPKTR